MKIVSFKAAKALKEAGYPQGLSNYLYNEDGYKKAGSLLTLSSRYECEQWNLDTSTKIDAPYASDVWIWLWREKKIIIDVGSNERGILASIWTSEMDKIWDNMSINYTDPEEALIAGINYLIDNDYIK